jgi:hypothetical protein
METGGRFILPLFLTTNLYSQLEMAKGREFSVTAMKKTRTAFAVVNTGLFIR